MTDFKHRLRSMKKKMALQAALLPSQSATSGLCIKYKDIGQDIGYL